MPLGALDLSPQNAGGDDAIDSDFDPATARTAPIVLASGTVVANIDAGLRILLLFIDDFEGGDLSRWTTMTPQRRRHRLEHPQEAVDLSRQTGLSCIA